MTDCQSFFSNIEPKHHAITIYRAGGEIHLVHGKDQANILLPNFSLASISDIFHVFGVFKNILSIGAIDDIGVLLIFSSKECKLIDDTTHHVIASTPCHWASHIWKK